MRKKVIAGNWKMNKNLEEGLALAAEVANIAKDGRILQYARDTAEKVLQGDPLLEKPENHILSKQLTKLARQKLNWSMIS